MAGDTNNRRNVSNHNQIEQQVLGAAARGWRLFPVKARSKAPLISRWPELATTDETQLKAWLRKQPNCNWGLATGLGSGILVLDADSDAALAQLSTLGPLPRTFTVRTARGKHFYFRYPANCDVPNSLSKIAEGLDVKSERGYVLLPPSVHPSGAFYEVVDDVDPVHAPDWLLTKLVAKVPRHTAPARPHGAAQSDKPIIEGSRNSRLTQLAGSMQRKGMSPDAIEAALLKENERRCDPPLDENEVRRIVGSIVRYEPTENHSEVQLIVGERPCALMVPDAELLLRSLQEERIFQTPVSRRLIRVVPHKHDPNPDKSARRDAEASLLTDVDAQYLQLALGRSGRVLKSGKSGLIPADVPRQVAEMMLSSVRSSPDMTSWSRLKKISVTPILLPNGNIVAEPGYHSGSQIWIDTRGVSFSEFSATKPALSYRQCRQLIEEHIYPFLCEYSFAKEQPGQQWHQTGAFAVVLSALMSIDDRHNLSAVPMHCVSAPTQSCGKTRLVQAICSAVTGTQPTIVTYDGADEFAKHIPVLLGKGDSAICIDNVIMSLNNAKLAALLTQEYGFTNRILGRSDDVTIENVSVLFATGVNLQLSGDMPTRCLLIRIEPEDDRPEQKKFPFDQVERAKELFPRAVMSVKAVLRAHQLAGFPGHAHLKCASRFPHWDKRIRAAIVWAGYADPIITQDAVRTDDPLRNDSLRALWMLRDRFREKPFLVCELPSALPPNSVEALKQITGHKDSELLNERKIGKYFSSHLCGRWFEGMRLSKSGKNPGGRIEWRIEARLTEPLPSPNEASQGPEEEPL